MTAHFDMAATIAPKSDQLNADDLISGPRTITITRVSGNDNPDQPVNVFYESDNGKPFRPCKSMRRVMVHVWGPDAQAYVGRSMTIYRDPAVQFGGMQVGGIRISHMSHIDRVQQMALTATRAKRAPFRVEPLKDAPKPATTETDEEYLKKSARDAAKKGTEAFKDWWRDNPDKRRAANTIISDLKSICAIADDQAKSEADPFAGSIDATDHDPTPTPEQIAAAQAEAEAFARSQEQE